MVFKSVETYAFCHKIHSTAINCVNKKFLKKHQWILQRPETENQLHHNEKKNPNNNSKIWYLCWGIRVHERRIETVDFDRLIIMFLYIKYNKIKMQHDKMHPALTQKP